MNAVRPAQLALVLAILLAPALSAAQTPASLPAPGVVEFVPTGALIGDGRTVTLHILAVSPDGQPMTGLRLRAHASEGKVTGVADSGQGLYLVSYVTPELSAPETVQLSLRGKTADRQTLSSSTQVQVVPGGARSVEINVTPQQITLSEQSSAALSITIPDGLDLQAEDLVALASAGEVTGIQRTGAGTFTAQYTPPALNYPQLAIITLADRRDPEHVYGYGGLPLIGKVDYPVKTQPNASVTLTISGDTFGPTQANGRGTAKVPIVVPPGVTRATKTTTISGVTTPEEVDLRVPETPRLQLFPLVDALPADGTTAYTVRAVVRTPTGAPDATADVVFTASSGSFGPVSGEDGVYTATYTPIAAITPIQATLTVALRGSSSQQSSDTVSLVPPLPEAVHLTSEPAELDEGTGTLRVFAKAIGPAGRGLDGREWSVLSVGGELTGPATDLRNGDYRFDLQTETSSGTALVAVPQTAATGNPPARVLLHALDATIAADGTSLTPVAAAVVDAYGHPVPRVAVDFTVEGDGVFPERLITDSRGMALAFYTAGSTPGLVGLHGTNARALGGDAWVLQGAPDLALDLPFSGDPAAAAIAERWAASLSLLEVPRAGAPSALLAAQAPELEPQPEPETEPEGEPDTQPEGKPDTQPEGEPDTQPEGAPDTQPEGAPDTQPEGAPEPPADPANTRVEAAADAAVTRLDVRVLPDTVAPGTPVKVRIGVLTAEDQGVPGRDLEFMVSAGTVGEASYLGGGEYEAELSVPAGTTGELKLTVALSDGTQAAFIKVPVAPAPVAEDAVSLDVPDTPVVEDRPPKTPREPGEHPWLRARAGLVASSYWYLQNPTRSAGPLLPEALAVGGREGDKNAKPMGAEASARAWFIDYVGADASFRATRYSLTAPEFNGNAVPDTVWALRVAGLARYPFEVNGNRFHIGGRVGVVLDDFLVFRGDFASGTIEYQALTVPGLELGIEAGAELGDVFVRAGLSEGLAYATRPYNTQVDVRAGYALTDLLFADAGFVHQRRHIDIIGTNSGDVLGQLSDGHTLFTVGVGMQLE